MPVEAGASWAIVMDWTLPTRGADGPLVLAPFNVMDGTFKFLSSVHRKDSVYHGLCRLAEKVNPAADSRRVNSRRTVLAPFNVMDGTLKFLSLVCAERIVRNSSI
ncbi:hypothetical protein CEXT_719431 [Caerostris extrusa]|uniref:Uncharacterized protein n=1 Tax=Caerostris extrusa TaxID=172846 RepID=A0AAV4U1B7_CAEEX|nr:hypothetical protein CEXT_719431 [Caerostris extrusa]